MIYVLHHNDPDGYMSAAVVAFFYLEKQRDELIKFVEMDYNRTFDATSITKEDLIYVVDFTLYPFKRMVELADKCKELIWIDHHASAIEEYQKYKLTENRQLTGLRKVGEGGCELAWRFLFGKTPSPLAVHLIGRYDVWDKTVVEAEAFMYGIQAAPIQPPASIQVKGYSWKWPLLSLFAKDMDYLCEPIIQQGEIILRYLKQRYVQTIKEAFEIRLGTTPCLCVNAVGNSNLFESVDPDFELYPVHMVFHMLADQRIKASLYSKDTVDVSAIAKQFGGGGHKNAAGFVIPFEALHKFLNYY